MATRTAGEAKDDSALYRWGTGVVAGLISAVVTGLVIQFGFDSTVLATGIPSGFGLSGIVAGWILFLGIGAVLGLVYAVIAHRDRARTYAVRPNAGAYLGALYGVVLWVLAMIIVPLWMSAGTGGIGEYAVNLQGVLSYVLLGVLIGLLYGVSPYTD